MVWAPCSVVYCSWCSCGFCARELLSHMCTEARVHTHTLHSLWPHLTLPNHNAIKASIWNLTEFTKFILSTQYTSGDNIKGPQTQTKFIVCVSGGHRSIAQLEPTSQHISPKPSLCYTLTSKDAGWHFHVTLKTTANRKGMGEHQHSENMSRA